MDLNEINKYIQIGCGYIEISREYLNNYSGICRRVFLRKNKIQIDYIDNSYTYSNEGEETFYFYYNNMNETIKYAEIYLKKPINQWMNYNLIYNKWHFDENRECKNSWKRLFEDFYNKNLYFPENFNKFSIRTLYATAIFIGIVLPNDNFNIVEEKINSNIELLNSNFEFNNY